MKAFLNPNELDVVKMGAGGNGMSNGCNTVQKLNRLLVSTIKLHFRMGNDQSVGTIISNSINNTNQDSNDVNPVDL